MNRQQERALNRQRRLLEGARKRLQDALEHLARHVSEALRNLNEDDRAGALSNLSLRSQEAMVAQAEMSALKEGLEAMEDLLREE